MYEFVNNVQGMGKFTRDRFDHERLVTDSVAAAADLIARPKLLLAVLGMLKNPVAPLTLTRTYGIARSTSGFYLRLLEASGLVRKVAGMDRRRSYYVLTDFGKEVLGKARELLTNTLIDKCKDRASEDYIVLEKDCLGKFLDAYGKHKGKVMKWLGIREAMVGYKTQYVIEVAEG